jgi:hypothetical protein
MSPLDDTSVKAENGREMTTSRVVPVVFLLAFLAADRFAFAAEDESTGAPTNLKVLADNGKRLKSGMTQMTKGLGANCNDRHKKGADKANDENPIKHDARAFLKAVVGEKDAKKRDAALAELLGALKKDKPIDPELLWKGIALFEKKAAAVEK